MKSLFNLLLFMPSLVIGQIFIETKNSPESEIDITKFEGETINIKIVNKLGVNYSIYLNSKNPISRTSNPFKVRKTTKIFDADSQVSINKKVDLIAFFNKWGYNLIDEKNILKSMIPPVRKTSEGKIFQTTELVFKKNIKS